MTALFFYGMGALERFRFAFLYDCRCASNRQYAAVNDFLMAGAASRLRKNFVRRLIFVNLMTKKGRRGGFCGLRANIHKGTLVMLPDLHNERI